MKISAELVFELFPIVMKKIGYVPHTDPSKVRALVSQPRFQKGVVEGNRMDCANWLMIHHQRREARKAAGDLHLNGWEFYLAQRVFRGINAVARKTFIK